MFVYYDVKASLESGTATGASFVSNATPNTSVSHLRFLTAAGRAVSIQALYLQGRDSAATSISGLSVRLIRWSTTASSVGTAGGVRARDPGAPASSIAAVANFATDASVITQGTGGPTLQLMTGCGRAGPGGWVAPNPDSMIYLAPAGGVNGNLDMTSGSGGASISFDATIEHQE